MSPASCATDPATKATARLRERMTALDSQRRRHGYRMPHRRLRPDGWAVDVERAYRIYRVEGLMVRRRRRKKLPLPERQPLVRPLQPGEVWSMDFVSDDLANGRGVKTLTAVDDCSKDVIQIAADTSMPALHATRLLDQAGRQSGLPEAILTDSGPAFAGRTMQTWAARSGELARGLQAPPAARHPGAHPAGPVRREVPPARCRTSRLPASTTAQSPGLWTELHRNSGAAHARRM